METTVRIDDDLLPVLEKRARREGVSPAQWVNHALRLELTSEPPPREPSAPYREKTFRMGAPRINIDKALAVAAELEDEETVRKMVAGK